LAYCHHVGFSNPRLPGAVIGALRENGIADGLIVDLGCNGGHLLAALTQSGYGTIGIDLSAAALALAEKRHSVKCSVTPRKRGVIHSRMTIFFNPALPLSHLAVC